MRVWKLSVPVLVFVWMSLRSFGPIELGLGLVFGLLSVYPIRRIYRTDYPIPLVPGLLGWGSLYAALFVYGVVKANLSMAYFVLRPSRVEPKVVDVPLEVETELGVSLIANSITLTPGTLTLDYVEEEHVLRVHAISGTAEEVVSDMDRLQGLASRMGV